MSTIARFIAKCLTSGTLGVLCAVGATSAVAQVSAEFCGPIESGSGPWDYRVDKQYLPLVENAHFTSLVENLVRGKTGESVGPDLDYTLARFPNHHRALVAVSKLYDKKLPEAVTRLPRPTECYFERAVRFRKNDTVVRLLYAQFLAKVGRSGEAAGQLQVAAALQPESAITQRNVGLLYLEMKAYDQALAQAHIVARLDPAETVLRQALERAKRWREPAPAVVPEATTAAPAASEPALAASASVSAASASAPAPAASQ